MSEGLARTSLCLLVLRWVTTEPVAVGAAADPTPIRPVRGLVRSASFSIT